MKITEILDLSCVCSDLKAQNKAEVIKELVEILYQNGIVKEKEEVVNVLIERENLGSTGIGYGIAIPHGKTDQVQKLAAVLGKSNQGIDFDSLDGELVKLFFLLAAPKKEDTGLHLKALAKISNLLKDKSFRQQLLSSASAEEMYNFILKEDEGD